MKKEGKILALIFLSVFMISIFASVVGAQVSQVFDPIRDMFYNWTRGATSVNVAKYAFILLLLILIYSIVSVLPFIKKLNVYVKILFAAVVAFLSTAYLTPEEVYAMLVSYGAMGLILGGIVPLMILIFFTLEMSKEGFGGLIISQITWVGFIVFLLVKLVSFFIQDLIGWWTMGIYIGLILISLFITFKMKDVHMYLLGKSLEYGVTESEQVNKTVVAQRIKEMKRLQAEASPEEAANIQKKIDNLSRFLGKI